MSYAEHRPGRHTPPDPCPTTLAAVRREIEYHQRRLRELRTVEMESRRVLTELYVREAELASGWPVGGSPREW